MNGTEGQDSKKQMVIKTKRFMENEKIEDLQRLFSYTESTTAHIWL